MSWIPDIYVLCNSKHEPLRYQFLLRHLPSRGIPKEKIHFVSTIWGSDVTTELMQQVTSPFLNRFGMKHNLSLQSPALSRGEISLMITFHECMRQILEAGHDRVIVFESDVTLREDFISRLETVLKGCDDGREWDYVSLGEGVGTRPPNCDTSYFGEQKLYIPPHKWVFRCCDSMLLRRRFLEKVFQTFIPFRECLDWEMNVQLMIHDGVAWWADPPIVEPGTGRGKMNSSLPT
jgi:hypothetical protein